MYLVTLDLFSVQSEPHEFIHCKKSLSSLFSVRPVSVDEMSRNLNVSKVAAAELMKQYLLCLQNMRLGYITIYLQILTPRAYIFIKEYENIL